MVSFPRFVRPHTIIIKHKIGEDDNMDAIFEETVIRYVKFDENYKMIQSRKGIECNDDALCIIDLNDLYAMKNGKRCKYISHTKYSRQDGYFSIFKDDIIIFDEREYTVNSINEINPLSNLPIFVEVRANAA
nr:MAG TPA: Minor capsid protein [Caudoviricetes sp.]